MILNLSASPYHKGKQQFREKMLSVRASDNVTHIAYANLVGGQDELVFDGNSTVFDEEGTLLGRAAAFQEDLLVVDLQTEHMLRTRLHDIRHREAIISRTARAGVPGRSACIRKRARVRQGIPAAAVATAPGAAMRVPACGRGHGTAGCWAWTRQPRSMPQWCWASMIM